MGATQCGDQIEPDQIGAWWRQEPLFWGEGGCVDPWQVFHVTNRSQGQEDWAGKGVAPGRSAAFQTG
jgi:hypothetical protein